LINLGLGKIDFQLTPSQHLFYKYFKQTATYYSDGGMRRLVLAMSRFLATPMS
jgi:hypothetical protein